MPREGWLPQDTEGLWAALLSEDTARVQNVPLLQEGVAEGDVVRFTTDTEGRHLGVGRRQQDRADLDGRQCERLVDGGAQNLWVFDKDSLQYLGLNWETTSDSRIGPKGTVISAESVLQQAYVDRSACAPRSNDPRPVPARPGSRAPQSTRRQNESIGPSPSPGSRTGRLPRGADGPSGRPDRTTAVKGS